MISSEIAFRLIQGLVIVVIAGLLFVGGYLFFGAVPEFETEAIETKVVLERFQATADIYQARRGSYDGVCADLLLPANIACNGTDSAYALETRLSDRSLVCADSTGAVKSNSIALQSATKCK